jgi:hypothetical protein
MMIFEGGRQLSRSLFEEASLLNRQVVAPMVMTEIDLSCVRNSGMIKQFLAKATLGHIFWLRSATLLQQPQASSAHALDPQPYAAFLEAWVS